MTSQQLCRGSQFFHGRDQGAHVIEEVLPIERIFPFGQRFITKSDGVGAQVDEIPPRFHIRALLFESVKEHTEIMGEWMCSPGAIQPCFDRFFHRLLGVKTENPIIESRRIKHVAQGL